MSRRKHITAASAVALGALLAAASCVPRPGPAGVACRASSCGADAGLTHGRRLVLSPVALAFIERGSRAVAGALPASVTLGRSGDSPSAVLLRFELPREVEVLEAYLLVARGDDASGTGGGEGVGLHAERIVEDWAPGSVTWLHGPELRSAAARPFLVRRGGPRAMRVDVTDAIRAPAAKDEPADHGLALVADRSTPGGVVIALGPSPSSPAVGDPDQAESPSPLEPRLELYVQ